MLCNKCNRFNMSDASVCAYCGAELKEDENIEKLKEFAGGRLSRGVKTDEESGSGEGALPVSESADAENSKTDSMPEEVTFDEIEMDDMSFLEYDNENDDVILDSGEKKAMRNTALLAIILAVLIDIVLVVCMVIYFSGVAEDIVTVNQDNVQSIGIDYDKAEN